MIFTSPYFSGYISTTLRAPSAQSPQFAKIMSISGLPASFWKRLLMAPKFPPWVRTMSPFCRHMVLAPLWTAFSAEHTPPMPAPTTTTSASTVSTMSVMGSGLSFQLAAAGCDAGSCEVLALSEAPSFGAESCGAQPAMVPSAAAPATAAPARNCLRFISMSISFRNILPC